jgi:hypothetical protein
MAARILGPARGDLADPGVSLDSWLAVPAAAQRGERLGVHIGGYPARVHDSLAETYPAVARLAGPEPFEALARRYAAGAVLTSYNLNDAGAHMPAFLRTDRLTDELPFLPDLAALEWCVARAFHAEQRPPLDPRALGWGMDDWTNAVLHFQPAVAVVSSVWPVLDLWAARDTPRREIEIEPRDRPDHVVVRRDDLTVRCESVSAAEARALSLLLADGRLFEVAARLDVEGFDPGAVLEWFSRWTSAGMIADATRAG